MKSFWAILKTVGFCSLLPCALAQMPTLASGTGASSSGGGVPQGDIPGGYCTYTVSGATLTFAPLASATQPCNLNTGIVTLAITSPVTAVLTGTSGNGTGFLYVTPQQIVTVGYNTTTSTINCTGCSTQSGVTQIPVSSLPLLALTWTANAWATPTDLRGLEHTVLNCTAGVMCPQDAVTGAYAVTSDPTAARSVNLHALTDGTTVSYNAGNYLLATGRLTFTTHGGSRALNVSNLMDTGNYLLYLVQDGTGGENLTGGTGCTWIVVGGAGSGAFPTLTASAGAVDIMTFTYDSGTTTCTAVFGLNAK